MITPFTPPTDNLFKFIAITGLVSFIAGLVLLVGYKNIPDELALKHQGELKILKKEIDILSAEIKHNIKSKIKEDSTWVKFENMNLIDSMNAELLFRLPLEEQKSFKTLLLKRERILHQKELIKYHEEQAQEYSDHYVWLFLGGEIVAILGFLGWWQYVQKPLDKMETLKFKLEKNKTLAEDLWQENCQSCLKSLRIMKQRGSEKDGSISKHYCSNC